MKKMYVSVAEFLENGGKLELGRNIYSNLNGSNIGEFQNHIDDSMIDIRQSTRNIRCGNRISFVKIDCQPIYK